VPGHDSLSAISRPHEKPQYQTQKREQHNDNDPQQLRATGGGTLENVDKRPDITDQNQYAEDPTAVSEVHHACISMSGTFLRRRSSLVSAHETHLALLLFAGHRHPLRNAIAGTWLLPVATSF
jgi:hypothetical protein